MRIRLPRVARHFPLALLLAALACLPGPARPVLPDEIQVYVDDLGGPGEFGLQLHANTTPQGPSGPDPAAAGERPTRHETRLTPEFSWGIGHGFELGMYAPVVVDEHLAAELAAFKARIKWVAGRDGRARGEEHGGAPGTGTFYGANLELAWTRSRFDHNERTAELRPILGWRDGDWLLAANPCLEFALAGGARQREPDFSPSFKLARRLAPGIMVGPEYYADTGPVRGLDPLQEQHHEVFLALDIDRRPWNVNLGIGRGLTRASDRWTLKAIVEIPVGD
jgi:hypothetical protein